MKTANFNMKRKEEIDNEEKETYVVKKLDELG